MRIIAILTVLVAFLPTHTLAASLREEFQAQTYFRPGNIAREQFDFSLFRQQRRTRWGVRKVRGFSLGAMEDVPLIDEAKPQAARGGRGLASGDELIEGTPHPKRPDNSSLGLSQRESVRSYVRRGGCPEGLPLDYALACRQALEERQTPLRSESFAGRGKHPSTEYLLRRAKNPKQDLRQATKQFTLQDRLRMVAPRPRFRLFDLSQ